VKGIPILDFSSTEAVFGTFMVPAIALCKKYTRDGVDISLVLPASERLQSLFHNGNWSHLIAPEKHARTTFSGYHHLPADSYVTAAEQHILVNKAMDVILGNLQVDRKNLKALEWCINEITDNVLNHASSDLGGVVQASTFPQRNSVEFVVADSGVGIRNTLGGRTDEDALSLAIQEGVTRDKRTNQGNGLYGSYRVAALSGGIFQMHSGRASLVCHGVDDVKLYTQNSALYPGTIVSSQIVCNDERLIEQALVFRGDPYIPSFDYIDQVFETESENVLKLRMREEAQGFGSREAGQIVRTKILNLLRADLRYVIELDFQDVRIVSSSFADEAIGKLFLEVGPMQFMRRIRFVSTDTTIQALLDRAILQRSSSIGTA
jgi:anti-sigma regulatory factor (Ser/Thr protein kinase)